MAAKYRKVDPRFWYDEKVSQLNPTGKLVAFHLITSPEGNRIGLFPMSQAAAAEHCGVTPESFRKAFDLVRESLNWGWDSRARVMYLPTWWKYNRPDHPNGFKGCLSDLVDVPQTYLLEQFMENTQYLPENFAKALGDQKESFRFGLPQEQEQEQEQDNTPCSPPRGEDKKRTKASRFVPPTVAEVDAYCQQRGNGIDAAAFVAHYQAGDWMRGKTKIRDWRACVRTWEARAAKAGGNGLDFLKLVSGDPS